jgi:arylsulfatase A-like enzyme
MMISPKRVTMSILASFTGICYAATSLAAASSPATHQVVLVVWDGMRPDFVNEKDSPTLWKLAKQGVNFRRHHSVYLSATNVNGTALVTGAYPDHSGIIANQEYRPKIDARKIIAIEDPDDIRKGDELSGGKYVAFPTIPEIVRAAGRQTIVATAKTVGFLQDRHLDPGRKDCAALVSGHMPAEETLAAIGALLGPFPNTYAQKDAWTTKALTEVLWKDRIPAFTLLWLSEPDGTEHSSAPGSEASHAAIKSSDDNLAAVLAALDRKHARSTTDIFVVSDHGFSTIERSIDLRKVLKDAGFNVATEFNSEPKPGDIMLAGNGGTVLFYVMQHDAAVPQRLVEFLQQCDFAGVIMTRDKIPGTFGLDEVKIDSEHAPDVAMAFRWNDEKNEFGVPGMIDADWNRKAGQGTHATLSRFDMHNTLIAAGPSIRRGQVSDLPSGNVDLAPTILHILGIAPPRPMDGRVLDEALTSSPVKQPKPETKTLEAKRRFPSGTWRQTLQISRVGSTVYLNEGNGAFDSSERD